MPVPFVYIGAPGGTPRSDDLLLQVVDTTRAAVPVPLMTTTQKNALAGAEEGDWVFDTTLNAPSYYTGSAWVEVYGSGTWQPLDSDLTALAGLSSTGLIARTGSGTASVRTITGTSNRISVTDGNGVSGNPTLTVPDSAQLSIAKITNLTSDGYVKTGSSDGTLSVATSVVAKAMAGSNVNGTVAAGATSYQALFTEGSLVSTEANARTVIPFDCTVKNLYLITTTAQGGGGTLVATVRRNSGATSITVTVSAGGAAATFSDTTHSQAFSAGDTLDIQFVNNDGGGASATIRTWVIELDTTI